MLRVASWKLFGPASQVSFALILNHLAGSVNGPEKAGGGGPIPSLATTFQTT